MDRQVAHQVAAAEVVREAQEVSLAVLRGVLAKGAHWEVQDLAEEAPQADLLVLGREAPQAHLLAVGREAPRADLLVVEGEAPQGDLLVVEGEARVGLLATQ